MTKSRRHLFVRRLCQHPPSPPLLPRPYHRAYTSEAERCTRAARSMVGSSAPPFPCKFGVDPKYNPLSANSWESQPEGHLRKSQHGLIRLLCPGVKS